MAQRLDQGCEEEEEEVFGTPDQDCEGEERFRTPVWNPGDPKTPEWDLQQLMDYEMMQKRRDYRIFLMNARLKCGGTPSGHTTVKPSGNTGWYPNQRTRPLSTNVSRQINFSAADMKRPRKPIRYLKKRFDEGMRCLQGALQPSGPQNADECAACGGPRRCHIGIEGPVDPNCQPRACRPKYPDFDNPSDYEHFAELTRLGGEYGSERSDDTGGWLYEN
ncbi:hypothetical protein GE061_019212 [Apolygus lucorum]|uniref:Uncharacterized protein n=1 Tax=Apolygus lucorum TaxID=248454 RepID=A0A6A4JT42_APOLU|nr:hypothetical protein GE061_019212 [Apolygus lucorum]